MYPVANSAAVRAVGPAKLSGVNLVVGIKPLFDATGPEKVVLAMIISPYKVKAYQSCMRLLGQSDKLVLPR
jgi:hypothetical protein